jgi:hypothetical protein
VCVCVVSLVGNDAVAVLCFIALARFGTRGRGLRAEHGLVRRSSFVVQADGTRAAAKWDAGTMSHFDHISLSFRTHFVFVSRSTVSDADASDALLFSPFS